MIYHDLFNRENTVSLGADITGKFREYSDNGGECQLHFFYITCQNISSRIYCLHVDYLSSADIFIRQNSSVSCLYSLFVWLFCLI